MIIFDEKKHAEKILKNNEYSTSKNQGVERCALVRYLTNEGFDYNYILNKLLEIPMQNKYLREEQKKIICNKIINKSNKYEYIHDIKVIIYEDEIDIINSIEDENCKNLLFVYLVYYKWASNIYSKSFFSKKDNIMMALVNDNDLWKIAKLSNLRVGERISLCGYLTSNNLYKEDIIKTSNYYYLPFVKDGGKVAIEISEYDDIVGELKYYNREPGYRRCDNCNRVIKKNNNKQKYCNDCAHDVNIKKTLSNRSLK